MPNITEYRIVALKQNSKTSRVIGTIADMLGAAQYNAKDGKLDIEEMPMVLDGCTVHMDQLSETSVVFRVIVPNILAFVYNLSAAERCFVILAEVDKYNLPKSAPEDKDDDDDEIDYWYGNI